MSVSNSIVIASTEIKGKLDESKPILENIKIAMKEAKNHWLIIDEEEKFKSAIGAVLLIAGDEDRQILEDELKGLRMISALQDGVPVDLVTAMATTQTKPENYFGLLKIWKEIK